MTGTEVVASPDDQALLLAVGRELVAERHTVGRAVSATLDSALDRDLGPGLLPALRTRSASASQLADHLCRQARILAHAQASLLMTDPEAALLARLLRGQRFAPQRAAR